MFTWEYPPHVVGGLGTYARDIVKYLRRLNVYPVIFTHNHNNSLPTYQYMEGVEIHRPKNVPLLSMLKLVSDEFKRWSDLRMISDVFSYNILSAAKFLNLVKYDQNIDVVAIHDWLSGISGLTIKESSDLPLVFHIHSTEELRSNLSDFIKSVEHTLGEKADKIITVSYAMRDHLISLGYDSEKIEVVWNGVDLELYDSKNVNKDLVENFKDKYNVKDNERVLLFIGRLTYIKGVHSLVEVFKRVVDKIRDVKLIIVGMGEESQNIRDKISSLGLDNKVFLEERWLSDEEKIALYSLADVCVFPSYAEPFGIVSLEAMAMEKPVIVSGVGVSGLREQITPEIGRTINPYDISSFADTVVELLTQEDLKEMGKKARKHVEKNFDVQITAKKTLEIYNSLIK